MTVNLFLSKYIFPLLLALGFIISPLFFWPWAAIPYEIPKVLFIERWIEILSILTIITITSSFIIKRNLDAKIIILLLVFLFSTLLSSLIGADFEKSLYGNYYREDGLLTLFHLVALFFIVILIWKNSWRDLMVKSIVIGSFFVGILNIFSGIKYYIFHDQSVVSWQGALGSTFGQPVFLGGYLLVTMPFIYYCFIKSSNYKTRFLFFLIAIIQVIAIILTQSLASFLGVILFLAFLFIESKKLPFRNLILFFLIILFVSLSAFYIWKATSKKVFVAEGRIRIFHKLILSVWQRPFLGWGWANVDYAFKSSIWPIKFDNDVYLDKAHSHFLEILTTTGIFGLLSYIGLTVLIIRNLYRKAYKGKKDLWYKTLLFGFILFLLHSQTNIISISEELTFWFIGSMATIQ